MKYLVFFIMLIALTSYSDNHKNNDHEHSHNHGHDHEKAKKKSLKSHQHGVGILNIAQEKNLVVFEFELPGYDVVGFEHKAKKKDDIKKVKQAIYTLEDSKNMLEINDEAKCKEENAEVTLLEEGNHTEFRSKYILNCTDIFNLNEISVLYFKNFKNSEKLNVKIVTEKASDVLELFSNNNIIEAKNFF